MNNKEIETFDTIIEPGASTKNYFYDLWQFRDLFYILSWRDIKVRYKQTVIGILWSVLPPLITMIIFTIVFSWIAKIPSETNIPYPILVFAGLIPWQFFSNAISESSNSLIINSQLITKVYFPRMIIPASSIITSFIDMGLALLVFLGLMIYFQYWPDWRLLFLPLALLLIFIMAFGVGLILTTLNLKYRDFRYVIPFIIQLGLYISPVGFSSNVVPEKWQWLYALNPLVGIIDLFRWCLLGTATLNYISLGISAGIGVVFLMIGFYYFRKMERNFADLI